MILSRPTSIPQPRSAVAGAVLLAALGAPSAHAFAPGVTCDASLASSICRVAVQPGMTLETTVGDLTELTGSSYRLEGTVTVVTPLARIPLNESSLTVELGDEPQVYGESAVPLDRMPMLEKAEFSTIPRAAVGLAGGDAVEALVGEKLPLNRGTGADGRARDASKPYLLFHMDAGVAFSLPMEAPLEKLGEVTFSVPGSMSATAVLDLFDPYVYLAYSKTGGIDLNDLKRRSDPDSAVVVYEIRDENDERVVMSFTLDTEAGTLVEHNALDGTTFHYRRDADGNYVGQNADGEPLVLQGAQFDALDRRQRDAEEDRRRQGDEDRESGGTPVDAIGVSLNGWVPFVAADTGGMPKDVAKFAGQLYLHGEVPLTPNVSIDGDVVTYVGEHGVAQGGNGEVSLGIPGLPDFIDFSIRLGNASAAVTVKDTEQKVFVAGELAPDTAFLADYLPIMPAQGARVEGYVGNDLLNTFLAIEGEMSMGADLLGELVGIDMNELALSRASMIVDRHGFEVTGLTRMQISPDIRLNGQVETYASMSWANPGDLSLSISGDMDVFGVALEDVTLELDAGGLFARGAFVTPISRLALDGRITAAGPQLSGKGALTIDMAKLTAAMGDAHATLSAAQREVDKLNREIGAMRNVVEGERAAHRAERERARATLSAAQGEVNRLNGRIAAEYRAINAHKAKIKAKYDWYKAGNVWQRPGRYTAYTAEKTWRTAAIGKHYTAIGALKASLAVAKGALDIAKGALTTLDRATASTPVDADPRVATLIAARATAMAALEAAKLPFANFPSLDAKIAAELAVSLGTEGISGTVSATLNGKTLRGTASFAPQPKICLQVPVHGAVCAAL